VLLALFFVSGACGLVYEVVWMRMLTLVFGATAFATSTILASFFTGLALGSFHFGRVADRGGNTLRLYALLEMGIGVFAFLMPVLFAGLTVLYVWVARQFDIGYYPLNLVRFVLSFLVLLVPATLMGGTLPVMVKFFARRRDLLARNIGHLYSVNTFGAVVGAVSAGFFLILWLGVKETAYVAGVVNLALGVTVLALARGLERGREAVPDGATPDLATEVEAGEPVAETAAGETADVAAIRTTGAAAHVASPGLARLVLWAIAVSGFCALALEVLWTRALVFFLDNSTHAFTTILAAFLVGIAIGSVIVARFIDRREKLFSWLGGLELAIGLSAVLAIPILAHLTPVFESMAHAAPDAMLPWKWVGLRFVKSLAVMLVPTVLMGMTFPLAARIYTRSLDRVGTALGKVYSVNTVGGVFGSVGAGFLLIPLIGVQDAIALVAAINVVIGVVLVLADPLLRRRTRLTAVAGPGAVFVCTGALLLPRGFGTLTSYYEGIEQQRVLSYEEGIGATVKVYEDIRGDRTVSISGFPVAGTAVGAQEAQKALAHLPLLLSRVAKPRVNIVGFGAGGTSWGVLQYDVQRVDCVELVPAVIRAAKWFPSVNHGVLSRPKYNLILGDGRNYALVTDRTYDVISVDATSPKMAGNGSLYALDFYRLLNRHLSDDGIVAQWLPVHLVSDFEMRMVARTFMEAFPHTTLWFTPQRRHIILLGTKKPLQIDFRAVSRKLQNERVRQELAQFRVRDAYDLLSWFLMGEDALAKYVKDVPVNTDDHPILEFTPALAYFVADQYTLQNTIRLSKVRQSVLPYLVDTGDTDSATAAVAARVQRRYEATQLSIRGDVYRYLNLPERAEAEYNAALRTDPRETNWLNDWRFAGEKP
jgi:spermidine synthase